MRRILVLMPIRSAATMALTGAEVRASKSGGDISPVPQAADLRVTVAAVTPSVRSVVSFPALAHRVTVLGFTWKSWATSADVSKGSTSTFSRGIGPRSAARSERPYSFSRHMLKPPDKSTIVLVPGAFASQTPKLGPTDPLSVAAVLRTVRLARLVTQLIGVALPNAVCVKAASRKN